MKLTLYLRAVRGGGAFGVEAKEDRYYEKLVKTVVNKNV